MRASSLVLSADVLQVKLVSGGDGRHRIVICTTGTAAWPEEKSVNDLRLDMATRVGIKPSCITMPMKNCKQFNIWLVIDLGGSERKARWVQFEVQRVLADQRYFPVAKHPSPHKGKNKQPYVNRSQVPAYAA